MTDARAFGLELQRARERSGLSLDQLAELTKVSASLYAGLERADISRWPAGIFRRAFVRSYAQAVGLDPENVLSRFLALYPDPDVAAAQPAAAAPSALPAEPAAPTPPAAGAARRLAAPIVDLLLAGVPAVAVSLLFGWRWFLPVAAGIGLVGHLLALTLLGTTPGGRLLLRQARRSAPPIPSEPEGKERLRVEGEAPAGAARRHQARHHSGPRAVAGPRTRRVQH
jgi:transcriptional regulator with XRE-family HTH domain